MPKESGELAEGRAGWRMAGNWTAEQIEAIETRGCDLLVSAAAGSGKTAVLVERIIHRITEDAQPMDIDRLLVVTFTRAAASEMSQRIGGAIAKKLEQDAQNVHLQNQMVLLNKADIKTIHAFCLQVIKEHFAILGIDPATRTADPGEVKLLQGQVLDELFEERYEAEDEGFFQLLETFADGTKDTRLKDLVRKVYTFAQGYPRPKALLEEMAEQFQLAEDATIDCCSWMDLIRDAVRGGVQFARFLLEAATQQAQETVGFDGYLERLQIETDALKVFEDALDEPYEKWRLAYLMVDFARLPAYRGDDKETAERVKALRDEAKGVVKKLGETYFAYDAPMQADLIRSLYPVAQALSTLVAQFMDRFAAAKAEKLIMDFTDYEHFALRVLVAEGSTLDHVIPTEAAEAIQERYDEVMIDEYQDSNMVQEMVLASVSGESRGENNRFMVGDIKQSIYRFRLAMPKIFNDKYQAYPLEKGGRTRKVVLSKNFRSRKGVLDGANFLFRQMMREDFGDVDYNDASALYAGATFPPFEGNSAGACEMLLVETSRKEELPEELEELDRRQLEAKIIAKKIRQMMAEGYHVLDKETGQYRPLQYRDIVVLMRSVKNWGSVLDDIFGKEEIPFYAEVAEGYYDVPEVETVVHLLRLIDNPRQDIPLLSVLHSPLYGVSADELMQIRLADGRGGLFYDCMEGYIADGEEKELQQKLQRFHTDLNRWRGYMRDFTLYNLIAIVYQESGYYGYVGVTGGGALRQANLRLLLEKAEQYEAGGRKGVFYFIRFVENLKTVEAESGSARVQNEGENLVRVMTIHKSKGLEFPVVFVADMAKQFNEMDVREPVIVHQTWGYGMNYTDIEKRVVYRTLSKTALAEAVRMENLSEELRVLYVALTRAKEKLILTGAVKDTLKSLERWQMVAEHTGERIPASRMRRGRSYLDWVMPALLRHRDAREPLEAWEVAYTSEQFLEDASQWQFSSFTREEAMLDLILEKEVMEKQEVTFSSWDSKQDYSGQRSAVFQQLSWTYPHLGATTLPTKLSISEIKRKYQEEMTGELVYRPTEIAMPKGKATALSPTQIGTAVHTVVEEADFNEGYDSGEKLEALIATLVEKERLTEAEAQALLESSKKKELLVFFGSAFMKRMKSATVLEKEKPFAMLLTPQEAHLETTGQETERVLVNGIIDCFFRDADGKLILLDYKSDRIFQEKLFLEKYQIQLALYRKALGQALGEDVAEGYIYSFAMEREIRVF